MVIIEVGARVKFHPNDTRYKDELTGRIERIDYLRTTCDICASDCGQILHLTGVPIENIIEEVKEPKAITRSEWSNLPTIGDDATVHEMPKPMFMAGDNVCYTRVYYQAGIEKRETCHGKIRAIHEYTTDKSITYDIGRLEAFNFVVDDHIPEAYIALEIPVKSPDELRKEKDPQYHFYDHVYLGLTADDGNYFTGVIDKVCKKDNGDFYYGVTLDREFKHCGDKYTHVYAEPANDGIRGRMFRVGEAVKFLPYPAASEAIIGWITGWEFNKDKRYMYHIRALSEDGRNWKYYKVPINQIKPISTSECYRGGFALSQGPRSNGKTYFDNYILWKHAMNSIYGLSPKDIYPTVICKDIQSFLEAPLASLDFSVDPEKAYKLWHDAYHKRCWNDHVDAMSNAVMRYCENDVKNTTELFKEELGMNVTLANKKETEELVEYQVNTPYSYRPKKIIFNGPATIVIWQDDSKTVVKCGEKEEYDRKLAFKYALHKRYAELKKTNYLRQFTKALEKTGDPQAAFIETFAKIEMNDRTVGAADEYFKAIEKHFKKEFES